MTAASDLNVLAQQRRRKQCWTSDDDHEKGNQRQKNTHKKIHPIAAFTRLQALETRNLHKR